MGYFEFKFERTKGLYSVALILEICNFECEFEFEKTEIKILNKSLKFLTGTKLKQLIDKNEQNSTKLDKECVRHYVLPWNFVNTVQDFNIPLLSVEFCQILLKCLYIFIQNSLLISGG
jgi:hypothetical protein